MTKSSTNALVVFAKPPVAGRVKTRLFGVLTPRGAAELHRACLEDTVAVANDVRGCRNWLFVAGRRSTTQRLARELHLGRSWRVRQQQGRDLGVRLSRALWQLSGKGAKRVVVIGTDTPWMGRQRIERAFRLLERADVVLGPSEDGGYYLVGARFFVPEMFRGIHWGSSRVFERTVQKLKNTRARFGLLPRDFDLDRPKDLSGARALLKKFPDRAPALAMFLGAQHAAPLRKKKRRTG